MPSIWTDRATVKASKLLKEQNELLRTLLTAQNETIKALNETNRLLRERLPKGGNCG